MSGPLRLVLFLALVLAGAGFGWWQQHRKSPEYLAEQALSKARQDLADGAWLPATTALVAVGQGATSHAEAARQTLRELLTALDHAPHQATEPLQYLAQLPSGQAAGIEAEALVQRATQLARLPGVSASTGVGILDAVDAALIDADRAAYHQLRERLLGDAVIAAPTDPHLVSQLAVYADQRGDEAAVHRLLDPLTEHLGSEEGARLLGTRFAAAGRHDDAHRLLKPYTDARLATLHQAESSFETLSTSIYQQALDDLRQGQADKAWYDAYQVMDETKKSDSVNRWIMERIRNNPQLVLAKRQLMQAAQVVPTAIDYGIVTLFRARKMADTDQRQAELKRAEDIFLTLKGVAGESESYQLWLAQVQWWLGKVDEGRKTFDDFLEQRKREAGPLLTVAHIRRDLGDESAAHALAEEAHGKATDDPLRHAAARLCSLTARELDDRRRWLERCDQQAIDTQAELDEVSGHLALRNGHRDEAVAALLRSAERWESLPVSASTLNNGALALHTAASLTGDLSRFRRCVDMLEEAQRMSPGNTIQMTNIDALLIDLAAADAMGTALDWTILKQLPDLDWIDYTYADQAGRAERIAAFRASDSTKRILANLDRLAVMAPREIRNHQLHLTVAEFLGDGPALDELGKRIAAGVDLKHREQTYQRQHDPAERAKRETQARTSATAALEQVRAVAEHLPQSCPPATAAAAIAGLVAAHLSAHQARLGDADHLAQAIARAEESHRVFPSVGSRIALIHALTIRAAASLSAADLRFAELAERHRADLTMDRLLPSYFAGNPALPDGVGQDLERVATLIAELIAVCPGTATADQWALLQSRHDPRTELVAKALAADPLRDKYLSLALALDPWGVGHVLSLAHQQLATGSRANAEATLAEARKRGLVVPDLP